VNPEPFVYLIWYLGETLCNMTAWQYFKDIFQILGIIISGVIAFLVFRMQKQKNKDDRELQKPVLQILNVQGKGWVLFNVGRGPALSVRFADKNNKWGMPVIAYSIPADTALLIKPEINYGGAIAAVYSDLLKNEYMAYCIGDTTSITQKGDKNWNQELYNLLHTNPKRSNSLMLTKNFN
jgi:hypothetical protein